MHMILSIDEFSKLIFYAELLGKDRKGYKLTETKWREYINEYELSGIGELGIVDVTLLITYMYQPKTPGSTDDFTTSRNLLFLQINHYDEEGLTINSTIQCKHNVPPHAFNNKLRYIGRNSTPEQDILDHLVEWTDMHELRENNTNAVNH